MKTVFLFIWTLIFLTESSAFGQTDLNEQATVIPCMAQPASCHQNIIYSPAFRASWTMLKEDIIGADIRLRYPVPLLPCLNNSPFHPLQNEGWFVRSGYIQHGIIDQIQEALKATFGITEHDLDRYRKEKEGIVCYSYLRTSIRFKYPFRSLEWQFGEGDKRVAVSCFGLPKFGERPDPVEQVRRQVTMFDYRSDHDFIIQIPDADSTRELILAKVPFQGDFLSTVAHVSGRIQYGYPDMLTRLDELIVPKINLSAVQHYTELEGKYLTNPGVTDYFFASACQKITFSMDEAGASATVNGQIIKIKGPQSRILAFDKPFLLIVRTIGSAEPDLVIWIANTDYLVPVY